MTESPMIKCPKCKTPFEYGQLVNVINFPDDIKLIFDLVEGRLNKLNCPVCSTEFFPKDILLIFDKDKNLIGLASNKEYEEVIRFEAKKLNSNVETASTYEELFRKLISWILPNIKSLFSNLDKVMDTPVENRTQVSFTPFQLRMLLSASRGYLNSLNSDRKKIEGNVQSLFEFAVKESINSIYMQCQLDNTILDLPEHITEAIPADCLTVEILNYLIGKCKKIVNVNLPDDFLSKWHLHFINAVVHYISGKSNPLQKEFASMINKVWQIKLNDPSYSEQYNYMLLNKKLGQQLLTFEDMFDANLNNILEAVEHNKFELIEKIGFIMDYYEWEQKFNTAAKERMRILGHIDEKNIKNAAGSITKGVMERVKFTEKGESAELNANIVSAPVEQMMASNQENIAKEIIGESLKLSEQNKDYISCIAICISCVKLMNKYSNFEISRDLILRIATKYNQFITGLPPLISFNYLNETANTMRHLGTFDDALKMYKRAEIFIKNLDEKDKLEARELIKRNTAIVYRDTGEFAKALLLFNELLKDKPDDFGLVQNIALFYSQINLNEKALQCLIPFAHTKGSSPNQNFGCNLSIAQFYALSGDKEKSYEHLLKLYQIREQYSIVQQCQLMNVALLSDLEPEKNNIEFNITESVEKFLMNKDLPKGNLIDTTYFFLLRRYLKFGDIAKARQLLTGNEWMQEIESKSWQLYYILTWYFYAIEDFVSAVKYIRKLLNCWNETIPVNENIDFTINWMNDKDDEQQHIISLACKLFLKKMIDVMDLLSVIDFNYGKDISAKLIHAEAFPSIAKVLEIISREYQDTEIFIMFEVDDGIRFINISPGNMRIIFAEDILCTVSEIEKIKLKTSRAYKNASPSPSLLKYTDIQLTDFMDIMKKIGNIFGQWLSDDTKQIYFVSGKTLSNLPLHLMKIKDELSLIEKFPVAYINNLSSLALLKKKEAKTKKAMIVTVTKENEKESYLQNARAASEQLAKYLNAEQYTTGSYHNEDATVQSITKAMNESNEAVFICHGTAGGEEYGAGICLSYQYILPPGLLPIKNSPVLKNFLLTWQDLDKLDHVPEIVVSVACSSGVVQVGKGGVQLGFEQALFAKGCSIIISPLWDVDQQSALYWLQRFYYNRCEYPDLEIIKHYQMTCMDTKEKYPHHFFWAPFILKGSSK